MQGGRRAVGGKSAVYAITTGIEQYKNVLLALRALQESMPIHMSAG